MKKVLLISNKVHHYRSRIYNDFAKLFKDEGYEFIVLSNEFQDISVPIEYAKIQKPFVISEYIKQIKTINPDVVISFLHLKDIILFPIILYCKLYDIPFVYWGHGLNLKDADNGFKKLIFRTIHRLSDAIILYTPNQLKLISDRNQGKTFVALNTLSFTESDIFREHIDDRVTLKSKYGIKEKKVLLYISRILPYKQLDVLLNEFRNRSDLALVIVGTPLSDRQQGIIKSTDNFYYLGEKYGDEVDEIYSIGDVFSTPGHIGLAINQAFYWSLPVVVLDRVHAPEIYYLKNEYNGYIVKSPELLKKRILELIHDDKRLAELKCNARATYERKMSIMVMFSGFRDAVNYVLNNKRKD